MKKVLLVADEPGWIFERHCKEIQKRATEYEIGIAYHRQNIPVLSQQYDLVYVLDPMPMRYPPANKTILGLRNQFLYEEHPNGARGLYIHGFPGRCVSMKDKCCMVQVVNRNQVKVLQDIVAPKPLVLAQHGIDETLFDVSKMGDKPVNERMAVSVSGRGSRNKAFGLVKQACDEGNWNYVTAQYGRSKRPKSKMPEFYYGADVHVCMSKSEGLNNPILEAGAMGLPVIATRTGAAEEIIRDGENGFLIDRTKCALIEALKKIEDPVVRKKMGEAMREEIMTNWTWAVRIHDYTRMFDMFFRRKDG
jgi:hypothetical protein